MKATTEQTAAQFAATNDVNADYIKAVDKWWRDRIEQEYMISPESKDPDYGMLVLIPTEEIGKLFAHFDNFSAAEIKEYAG